MGGAGRPGGRLPGHFFTPGVSSFTEFLSLAAPDLLPGRRALPPGSAAALAPAGTTIVAATFRDGVVMAGDRRATMGNLIAQRDIEKMFAADDYCIVGSGSSFAKSTLKKVWRVGLGSDDVVRRVVDSLYDAADDVSSNGGP